MKALASLSCILISISSFAQTETFDILTFQDPVGYKRTQTTDYVLFFKSIGQHYCQIAVFASRAGNGEPRQEFIAEWNDLVKKSKNVEAPSNAIQKGPLDGWSYVTGTAPIKYEKGDYVTMIISVIGHGRVTSISVDVNSDEFNADIEKFIVSIKPQVQQATQQQASQQQTITIVTPTNVSTGSYFKSNSAIVGVWRGFGTYTTISGVTNAAGTGFASITFSNSLSAKQVVFFDDGTFCNIMPDGGLIDYPTKRASDPNYWGKYTFANGKGIIDWDAFNTNNEFKIENEHLLYDDIAWRKISSIDGWKFDGTFTAEKNPTAYNGPEPTITFNSNGRFDDHGAIYWLRHVRGYNTDMQDQMTGSGTYSIENFTATFKYDDGRLIRMLILDLDAQDKSKPHEIALGGLKSFIDRK